MKPLRVSLLFFTLLLLPAFKCLAKEYIIYSIAQDIPMGEDNEIVKKNYYMNLGLQQGIREENTLDVYRVVSRLDPYASKKRFNYKIKIGELKVIHSEDNSSIAIRKSMREGENAPIFDSDGFFIGDFVSAHVDN